MKILSERKYGQPKLIKPKECNNKNLLGSIKFNKSCSCKVWKIENKYIILHRDWFSNSTDIDDAINRGIVEKKKNKFLYNDNFGYVILRNEALLEIEEIDLIKNHDFINLSAYLLRLLEKVIGVEPYSLERYEWCYFFEQFVKLIGKSNV